MPDKDMVQPGVHGAWVGGEPQEVLLTGCGGGEEGEGQGQDKAGCWARFSG